MSVLFWEILGVVLLTDVLIYAFRERITTFFAGHGFFSGKSESLPDISDLEKWRKK